MTEKFPSTGLNHVHSSVFSHHELRQVLAAYAKGVLSKNWKDYAIQSDKNQTTFCVIERGQGAPMAVIYSISRTRCAKQNGRDYYRVFDGERQICRTESFIEAINIFRTVGKPGEKKSKKLKVIR
jgi:hypothetical protein